MKDLSIAIFVSFSLISLCLYMHFAVLRNASRIRSGIEKSTRRPVLLVMAMIFLTHLTEIILFAATFWIMVDAGLGSLSGAHASTAADYFYFSIGSYTTLGIGDIAPEGPVRIVAGVEALTGLLLIAWSASFTYLLMERIWTSDED